MQVINTELAPAAIGAYSQAIKCGEFVFLSGQIPLEPKTMGLVSEEVGEQIEQVLKNLSLVCEAAGGTLANIVKLQVYLTDLSAFSQVNDIMQRYFTAPYPARAVIEVAGLPKGAKVEMDAVMYFSTGV